MEKVLRPLMQVQEVVNFFVPFFLEKRSILFQMFPIHINEMDRKLKKRIVIHTNQYKGITMYS